MVAWPPPNSVLNVPWKFSLMAANASRKRCLLVSSIFLIVSPVAVIESVRSFRWVVRNVWRVLKLVELIDGHHVDRAQAIDLAAASRAMCSSGVAEAAMAGSGAASAASSAVFHPRRHHGSAEVGTLAVDRAGLGSTGSGLHFGHHLVERHLQRVDARLREMRQMALLGRARHFELAHLGLNRFERLSRVAHRGFDAIGLLPKIRRAASSAARTSPRSASRRTPSRSSICTVSSTNRLRPSRFGLDIGGRRPATPDARFELAVGSPRGARPRHPARRVRSTSVAYDALASAARRASACSSLARIAQPMLRVRQLLVGGALLLLEPRNRLARFALPRLETVALLFGAAPLDLEQLDLLLHLLQVVGRPLQLQLEADDRLFLAMQIGIDRGQRVRHLRDPRLERGDLGDGLIALGFFAGDAIAQFLDLALDAENGAPFVLAAARDEHRGRARPRR